MRFGVITHGPPLYGGHNLGDPIQSIAAQQLLPRADIYLKREQLSSYDDENQKFWAILNGWFMHDPATFPPGASIVPFITSIHIRPTVEKDLMTSKVIAFLKAHEPIGCRDLWTRDMMQKYGIDAYFSGCLTMTLNREDFCDPLIKRQNIFVVDLDFLKPRKLRLRRSAFSLWDSRKKKFLSHLIKGLCASNYPNFRVGPFDYHMRHLKDRIQKAQRRLSLYASAELVITSKLHAALPCLAFGTPVLFVYDKPDDPRLSGLIENLNFISPQQARRGFSEGVWQINGTKTDWREIRNGTQYLAIRDRLKEQVAQALQNVLYHI